MTMDDGQHEQSPADKPPPDPWSGRLAVATIGLALVAFMIGAALISARGLPVPTQYWSTGSGLSGALLGILAPTPKSAGYDWTKDPENAPTGLKTLAKLGRELVNLLVDIWKNRQLLILLIVFAVSATLAVTKSSAPMATVAAAAGGALIGLIAPSPTTTKLQ
jgi:hypothetical protein